jgi:KDO2-lipid IV(A) lauroyltransferase
MQRKMAKPSRFSAFFNRWAIQHGFPILMKIAPRVPRWFALAGSVVVLRVVMGLYRAPRRAIARNLARILGRRPDSFQVKAAVRSMLHRYGNSWVDLFHFAQLPPARLLERVEVVEGRHHLDRLLAAGRGVLVVTAHLGSWELGGLLLREMGVPLSVVYVRDAYDGVEAARRHLRELIGVEGIAVEPEDGLASLPVLRALRQGRAVALQGDRDFNDRGRPVEFFGAPAPFPLGPFALARSTGVPLLPAFIAYTERRGFALHIEDPIEVEASGEREPAIAAAQERWVRILEKAVRRWPTQWYTFYEPWAANQG